MKRADPFRRLRITLATVEVALAAVAAYFWAIGGVEARAGALATFGLLALAVLNVPWVRLLETDRA